MGCLKLILIDLKFGFWSILFCYPDTCDSRRNAVKLVAEQVTAVEGLGVHLWRGFGFLSTSSFPLPSPFLPFFDRQFNSAKKLALGTMFRLMPSKWVCDRNKAVEQLINCFKLWDWAGSWRGKMTVSRPICTAPLRLTWERLSSIGFSKIVQMTPS